MLLLYRSLIWSHKPTNSVFLGVFGFECCFLKSFPKKSFLHSAKPKPNHFLLQQLPLFLVKNIWTVWCLKSLSAAVTPAPILLFCRYKYTIATIIINLYFFLTSVSHLYLYCILNTIFVYTYLSIVHSHKYYTINCTISLMSLLSSAFSLYQLFPLLPVSLYIQQRNVFYAHLLSLAFLK